MRRDKAYASGGIEVVDELVEYLKGDAVHFFPNGTPRSTPENTSTIIISPYPLAPAIGVAVHFDRYDHKNRFAD